MLDIYACRHKLDDSNENGNCNFFLFHSRYFVKGDKIVKRKKHIVLRTVPNYSSNPKNLNYDLYCKFNLIKYKSWIDSPASVWENLPETDENFIVCWTAFLQSKKG